MLYFTVEVTEEVKQKKRVRVRMGEGGQGYMTTGVFCPHQLRDLAAIGRTISASWSKIILVSLIGFLLIGVS